MNGYSSMFNRCGEVEKPSFSAVFLYMSRKFFREIWFLQLNVENGSSFGEVMTHNCRSFKILVFKKITPLLSFYEIFKICSRSKIC